MKKIVLLPETDIQIRRNAARASIARYEKFQREGNAATRGLGIVELVIVLGAALWVAFCLAPDFVIAVIGGAVFFWAVESLLKNAIAEGIKKSRDS